MFKNSQTISGFRIIEQGDLFEEAAVDGVSEHIIMLRLTVSGDAITVVQGSIHIDAA